MMEPIKFELKVTGVERRSGTMLRVKLGGEMKDAATVYMDTADTFKLDEEFEVIIRRKAQEEDEDDWNPSYESLKEEARKSPDGKIDF